MAKGTYGKTIGTIYDPAVGAPLDSRMMVPTFADLIAANTWKVDGGTSAESYAYYGMMVYVGNDPDSSKNGLYVLKASGSGTTTSDAKLESCWERISQTDSKIDTLQTKAISVSGITASTVETAFAEVAERLSGAATEGNLKALSDRISTAETNISAVSGVIDEVSDKVDVNAAAILANTQSISALQKSIGEIVTFRVEVVESLPTTGEDKVLYLVEDASAAAGTYIEYIWVNGAFEQIGSTAIDLSGYALKTEVASASATAKSEAIESANEYTDGKIAEVSAEITSSSELIAGLRTDVDAVSATAKSNSESAAKLRTDVDAVSGKADVNATSIAGLRTDVDAVSGKADANAAAILTKAEQSAVEAVVADVQTLSADVATKANADASNIDAADWQTKLGYATATVVNGIDTRLTAAETNIEAVSAVVKQNAADIATKASSTDLQAVSAVIKQNAADIATKASSTSVTELSGKVDDNTAAIATKASSASVTELSGKVDDNTAAIATKAAKSDLDTLSGIVDTKAAQSTVEALSTTVAGKQDKLHTYSEVYVEGEYQTAEINGDTIKLIGPDIQLSNGTDSIKIGSGVIIDGEVNGTAISTSIPAVASAVDTKLASEKAVADALDTKQNKLTAGSNINIASDNTISVSDLTKSSVGLDNVDNTSDANKPISTATQTALNKKQDKLNSITETASQVAEDYWEYSLNVNTVHTEIAATNGFTVSTDLGDMLDVTGSTVTVYGAINANSAVINSILGDAIDTTFSDEASTGNDHVPCTPIVKAALKEKQNSAISIDNITAKTVTGAIGEINTNKANKATTLSGYGITDTFIYDTEGIITIGGKSIKPIQVGDLIDANDIMGTVDSALHANNANNDKNGDDITTTYAKVSTLDDKQDKLKLYTESGEGLQDPDDPYSFASDSKTTINANDVRIRGKIISLATNYDAPGSTGQAINIGSQKIYISGDVYGTAISNEIPTASSASNTKITSEKAVADALILKQDKSDLTTSISSDSTDNQYPTAKAVYDFTSSFGTGSITSTTEITITPTTAQTATSITGALAKKARVVVIPNINNIGAVYIKESSTYSAINPIYPDPTNNVYEFSNMQNVRIFTDSIGDSVDLVIEYRG